MKGKVASDPLARVVAGQLAEYGAQLVGEPVVNCSLEGVEHSLLTQARSVLDRTYTLGLLWRLDGNASWAQRAVKELLHVTTDPSCKSWNPSHFLDSKYYCRPLEDGRPVPSVASCLGGGCLFSERHAY